MLHPNYPDTSLLWGWKTEAWFDVWSIEHLMMGIGLAEIAPLIRRALLRGETVSEAAARRLDFAFVLCCCFVWELLEHYLEAGAGPAAVTAWFQGVEFWGNRLVTDTAMVLLGAALCQKWRLIQIPARLFSITWLYVHIFVFPHSMYLHELLEKI